MWVLHLDDTNQLVVDFLFVSTFLLSTFSTFAFFHKRNRQFLIKIIFPYLEKVITQKCKLTLYPYFKSLVRWKCLYHCHCTTQSDEQVSTSPITVNKPEKSLIAQKYNAWFSDQVARKIWKCRWQYVLLDLLLRSKKKL